MNAQQITRLYFELVHVMDSIRYYEKYPTRAYLRDTIDKEATIEGKVRAMLSDGLIQRHVTPNWLLERFNIPNDPLEYYLDKKIQLQEL